jgi:hypothetical protein
MKTRRYRENAAARTAVIEVPVEAGLQTRLERSERPERGTPNP